jgi:acetyl esterase/lipase
LNHEPIAVSGAVIFPEELNRGPPRPVIAWAHPTSGVVSGCAPTLLPGLSTSIQGLDRFLDKGYVVVASDYPGLGSNGDHPYLIGRSEARAVIDSVRAARNLAKTGAGSRFIAWGHSQGGHAALFTATEVSTYAPELQLLGVAAAAPATKLIRLFQEVRDTSSGRSLTVMTMHSWSRVFDVKLSKFIPSRSQASFERLAGDCILTLADFFKISEHERALEREFLLSNPTEDPQIRAIMLENTPGFLPKGTPVFIAQSKADKLVLPAVTKSYAKQLCDGGAKVEFHVLNSGSHMFTGRDSANAAARWMDGIFKGRPPPSDC